MKTETYIQIIAALLCSLFFYAAVHKLSHYEQSVQEMHNQVFPGAIADVFSWLIPLLELVTILLLLLPSFRLSGLWLSLMLMVAFSLYIAVVMTGVFGRIPCSCGGILKNMPYAVHLVFNLLFVALAGIGLSRYHRRFKPKQQLFHFKRRKEVARKIG